ncbi:MAG: hypothetical protein SFU83_06585 [Meiothermus sp.]|nr:hypothetical protein [Meiothermus sp.]
MTTAMENLGHYLLREPILSGDSSDLEIFEGQDVRTGVTVLVFRPTSGPAPKPGLPAMIPWIDQPEGAWVAGVPMGAVQTSLLAGRVELGRVAQWTRQLVELVHQAQVQNISVGHILPELIWARGSKVWLAGVGVPAEGRNWDFAGLLASVRRMAGDGYADLPWREALEGYCEGSVEYQELKERLEAAPAEPLSSPSIPVVAAPEPAPPPPPAEPKPLSTSKTLKVLEGESRDGGAVGQQPPTPQPRRVKISEPVVQPALPEYGQPRPRTGLLPWLLVAVVVAGLAAGGYWLYLNRTPSTPAVTQPTEFPVEFRINPSTANANILILEAPSGSSMPINTVVLSLPGQIVFDRPGVYRIRIRVMGRTPIEQLITVPGPGSYSINLR